MCEALATSQAPGQSFAADWWKMRGVTKAHQGCREKTFEEIGAAIDVPLRPNGWICGFVPKYESKAGCTHTLHVEFTVIWKRFL